MPGVEVRVNLPGPPSPTLPRTCLVLGAPLEQDTDTVGEPPVEFLRFSRCSGRELDHQGSGPHSGDALSRFLVASGATDESTQAPSRRDPSPIRAASSRRQMPVAPLGCSAASPPGTRVERGVTSSIRKGRSLPRWRMRATRHRISIPSGSRRPPSVGPSTPRPSSSSRRASARRSSEAAQ